jgi:hypothetical protein
MAVHGRVRVSGQPQAARHDIARTQPLAHQHSPSTVCYVDVATLLVDVPANRTSRMLPSITDSPSGTL